MCCARQVCFLACTLTWWIMYTSLLVLLVSLSCGLPKPQSGCVTSCEIKVRHDDVIAWPRFCSSHALTHVRDQATTACRRPVLALSWGLLNGGDTGVAKLLLETTATSGDQHDNIFATWQGPCGTQLSQLHFAYTCVQPGLPLTTNRW